MQPQLSIDVDGRSCDSAEDPGGWRHLLELAGAISSADEAGVAPRWRSPTHAVRGDEPRRLGTFLRGCASACASSPAGADRRPRLRGRPDLHGYRARSMLLGGPARLSGCCWAAAQGRAHIGAGCDANGAILTCLHRRVSPSLRGRQSAGKVSSWHETTWGRRSTAEDFTAASPAWSGRMSLPVRA